MGWGWRSKYRTSSYSSDFEFIIVVFCFKCILVLLARRDSGELRCPLIILILFRLKLREMSEKLHIYV